MSGSTSYNKGLLSSKKPAADDDDDILDNILDDITAARGMDPIGSTAKRPQTTGNFNSRKESLWSAGPPKDAFGSKYGGNDLEDDLAGLDDEFNDNNDDDDDLDEDDDELGGGYGFSGNKASSHQRSNELLDRKRALFGGGGGAKAP